MKIHPQKISGHRNTSSRPRSSADAALIIATLIGLAGCAYPSITGQPIIGRPSITAHPTAAHPTTAQPTTGTGRPRTTAPSIDQSVTDTPSTAHAPTAGNAWAALTGRAVTAAGQPVSDVAIEFKNVVPCADICYQPHTTTNSTGTYSINLDDGEYNALCISENPDDECGPRGGDGGPFPVHVPPNNQTIDFIVCPLSEYPACLSQS